MKVWFSTRTPREQGLLWVMLALALVLAGYQFLYRPVADNYLVAQDKAQTAMRDLETVAKSAPLLAPSSSQLEPSSFDRDTLIRAAAQYDLSITRVQPHGEGKFEVWFDSADGQMILRFLFALETEYSARILNMMITRKEGQYVTARLTLGPQ